MNILPHKSWNPWSAKNIERVRRDEAEHEREQGRLQKRARQADSEARYEVLRERSSKRRKLDEDGSFLSTGPAASSSSSSSSSTAETTMTVADIFSALDAPTVQDTAKETRQPTPKRHPFAPPARTGALGEGSLDLEHKTPFYERAARCEVTPETDPRFLRDKRRQTLEDPFTLFRSRSSPKLCSAPLPSSSSSSSSSSSGSAFRAPLPLDRPSHRASERDPKRAPSDDLDLERMRRERAEREELERRRAQSVLCASEPTRRRASSTSFDPRAGRVRGREL